MASVSSLDWSLVQAFLAVAERGSLSAAARLLGVSQPTLGRQVRAMEEQLGVELFQRKGNGLVPTETATSLLSAARAMRDAAANIELQAAGKEHGLEGTVRITASVVVTLGYLAQIVAELRVLEPSISVELVPSDATSNLHFREADIAIRMYRPEQLDLIAQHLGDLQLRAFASESYVARRGLPTQVEELLEHDVVGLDKQSAVVDAFVAGGLAVDREWFKTRTDDPAAYWALVCAGCGIGFTQAVVGRNTANMVEVPLPLNVPRLPLWLTAHESLRRMPRVARVWNILARGLRDVIAAQDGADA